MLVRKWLRLGMLGAVLGLSLLETGCRDERNANTTGRQTTGTSDSGGPVTTASPGGPNVGPNEGTPGGVR
jgi:hypothetical protein